MDDHSSLNEQPDSPLPAESASYTGAFFPRARHFVVAGGTFTSNTITEVVPSGVLFSFCLHPTLPR
ncbi:hypothetical protein C8R45DRAFT_1096694 [Mycena sanguinolenta]|nr:hypothetical protein C8R45DRAFT_1096694 [Mycena sanguinolenta]